MSHTTELWRLPAAGLVERLQRRELSPLELIDAALERIAQTEPAINALPTVCAGRARAQAHRIMAGGLEVPGDGRGWLAGLPVVVKDMVDVEGVRTTYGSPLFEDHVPKHSAIEVRRLERHGAVVLAKSNTPEFAAGANTFNEVFGVTRNPFDTQLTSGGSSGGSAAALACGSAWLATGSDLGGSLRTPAAFCSVVGLRPSPGRVPQGPQALPFQNLDVTGPMARNVADLALMLDAMAGFDAGDPLSFDAPPVSFTECLRRPLTQCRVAYSPDLGGLTPVDPQIANITRAAARRLGVAFTLTEDTAPDFEGASEAFETLRAALFVGRLGPLLERHRHCLKPEIVDNIERGLALDAARIAAAERTRGRLRQNVEAFFVDFDLLLTPAAIVPPFDHRQRWLEAVGAHRFSTYTGWLAITFAITLTGLPALSLPCGFTREGLPVGLQMVAPPRGEAFLLRAAVLLEEVLAVGAVTPLEPARAGEEERR